MTIRRTLLAAVLLVLPFAAEAQSVNGMYVAGGAGWNWRESFDTDVSSAFGAPNGFFNMRTEPDVGWAGVASLGWGFGNGLRIELEGNRRGNKTSKNDVSVLGFFHFPSTKTTGNIRTTGMMANVFYDFRIGSVMPYIGGGIGFANSRFDSVGAEIGGLMTGVRGSETGFAYQGIAGLAVPVATVPGLAITAEYRYFATSDMTVDVANWLPGLIGVTGKTTANDSEHSVMFGLRYNFGTP